MSEREFWERCYSHVGLSILSKIKCHRHFPHTVRFLKLDLVILYRKNPFIFLQHDAFIRQL